MEKGVVKYRDQLRKKHSRIQEPRGLFRVWKCGLRTGGLGHVQSLISWKVHVTLYQDSPTLFANTNPATERNETVAGCTDMEIYLAGHGRTRTRHGGTPSPPNYRKSSQDSLGRELGTVSLCLGKGATTPNLSLPPQPPYFHLPVGAPHPLALGQLEARPNRKRKLRHCMGTTKPKRKRRYVETMATFWLG